MTEPLGVGGRTGPISARIPVIARRHRNAAALGLSRFGLFPGQELALMLLWEREPRLQRDLATELRIEAPTMTQTLQRLEAAGLLRRRRASPDTRQVEVELTEAGRALREPVLAWWADLEERTTSALSPAERAELARLLDQVDAAVGEPLPE